ncbi:hypothetical protein HanXRQr2_Chr12g0524301 [Helianthus annuus]|uniref:Uncharacterized protein n=1 Tax=Helianthus annuus TaxID=4232 RepID=A0A9K3HES6_HELAN|nr:hypothetical protein HanXRQr2_Chr12g0524301 [Helianthus annuus]
MLIPIIFTRNPAGLFLIGTLLITNIVYNTKNTLFRKQQHIDRDRVKYKSISSGFEILLRPFFRGQGWVPTLLGRVQIWLYELFKKYFSHISSLKYVP